MNITIPDFGNFNAKEKLNRIKSLFIAITEIVKKDTGILKPTYSMVLFTILKTSLFFLGLILIIEKMSIGLGVLLLFSWLLLTVYKHFFFVKKKTLQSIMMHQTILTGSTDITKAKQEFNGISGKMFYIGLTDFFIGSGKKWNSQNRNFIFVFLFSVLEEVWDLLKNFMIPVVAIEKISLKEAVDELKLLKTKVPETLVGILGVDFVGSFIIGALLPIYIIIFLLMTVVAYGMPFVVDVVSFTAIGFEFSVSAFIFGFYLITLFTTIIGVFAVSVKTFYFTIFYMLIKHPDMIPATLAPKLVGFVGMRKATQQIAACPKCSAKLVHKVATKGQHKGKKFILCSLYPKCKHINISPN